MIDPVANILVPSGDIANDRYGHRITPYPRPGGRTTSSATSRPKDPRLDLVSLDHGGMSWRTARHDPGRSDPLHLAGGSPALLRAPFERDRFGPIARRGPSLYRSSS